MGQLYYFDIRQLLIIIFHFILGFPPVAFMSIDGTYVKIMVPFQDDAIYTCRKFFHALNVLVCAGKFLLKTTMF
jgi:hypothetical protein